MPVHKINWSNFDHLLGKQSDKEISFLAGCTIDNVRYRRKRFGIPPAIYSTWTNEDSVLSEQGLVQCVKCKEIKSKVDFDPEKNSHSGTKRTCKSCVSVRRRQRWLKIKQKYIRLLGSECQNCGFNSYLAPLQFHHVLDNEKEYTLSKIILSENKVKEILLELDKCCILCSNCHDAFHSAELKLIFKKQKAGWTVSNPQK